ncbi:MAG: hypothetical protein PHQ12_01055 [Chthoniobacteraceae bacterium]|nr:hypothetical protein [Chthoniobacteraceae bacterium]
MNSDDPKLTAYALGELSGPERDAVEQRLRDDPNLRAEVDETAAFGRMLTGAFHAEPAPATLAPAQRAEVLEEARHGRKTIPFPHRPWVVWTLRIAAALVALAALGRFVHVPAARPPHVATVSQMEGADPEDRFVAKGEALPADSLLAKNSGETRPNADVVGGSVAAPAKEPLGLDQSAASSDFLSLTNSQTTPALAFRNTNNASPLDLTAQKPRAEGADAAGAADRPAERLEAPAATAGARYSLETKVQSQIGFAGQNFGNGTPIDARAAAALAEAPARSAAPAAPSAPAAASQPLLAGQVSLKNKQAAGLSRGGGAITANGDGAALFGAVLLQGPSFSGKELAEAVNHYVALGEEGAIRELTELTAKAPGDRRLRERVGLVCRVLYTPRDAQALRPPRFGGERVLRDGNTYTGTKTVQPAKELKADKDGKSAAEREVSKDAEAPEESVADYLAFCRAHGVFRSLPVPLPKASPEGTPR